MEIQRLIVAGLLLATACATPNSGDGQEVNPPQVHVFTEQTIGYLLWSDDARIPAHMRKHYAERDPFLLGHVEEWEGFPSMKLFTQNVDRGFLVRTPDGGEFKASSGIGGTTTSDGTYRFVHIRVTGVSALDRRKPLQVIPTNQTSGYRWTVEAGAKPLETL